jgi:cold shock CspA family protein
MDSSEWIEGMIREKANKLEQFAERITSCRVVVQPAGKHHQHGNQYEVHIDITVPGDEIVVTREPSDSSEHKVLTLAIGNAFDSARRQLEEYARRIRRDVKPHDSLPRAQVAEINPVDGFGFLQTRAGRRVYFHRNSVQNGGFENLDIDSEVAFREEHGEKGPQASLVKLIGPRPKEQE